MGLPFDKLRVVSPSTLLRAVSLSKGESRTMSLSNGGVEPRLVRRGKDADERGRTADLKGAGPRYPSAIQTSVTGFISEC